VFVLGCCNVLRQVHITYVTEEEIDEILRDIGMKKGHKMTFKREWAKLNCAASNWYTDA
jgi:hypothetical protein